MNKNKFLQPSGLNNHFYGEGLAFKDYIALMRNIILESRYDLNQENAGFIINANSPFMFEPAASHSNSSENGILFIHGLFDSPFFLADLGKYFSSRNFLTYSVLLPGHGTIPGDLLNIDYREWIKTVRYGVECLASRVKNVFLAGFSLGGTLALHHALQDKFCKGLILFAPALKTNSLINYLFVKYHKLFSWMRDKTKWYHIGEENNFAKYNSYAFNAGSQACYLMEEMHNLLATKPLRVPIFAIGTKQDETISNKAVMNFFMQQKHELSKMLIYSSDNEEVQDPRIILRKSYFPEKNILDFSHICLSISPENSYLGEQGNYRDFTHYANNCYQGTKNIYSGAISKKNLKSYIMQRLTYNPDYKNMIALLEDFLVKVSHSTSIQNTTF